MLEDVIRPFKKRKKERKEDFRPYWEQFVESEKAIQSLSAAALCRTYTKKKKERKKESLCGELNEFKFQEDFLIQGRGSRWLSRMEYR